MADNAYMLRLKQGKIYFTDNPPNNKNMYEVLKQYRFSKGGHKSNRYRPLTFSSKYDSLIRSAAARYGVDPMLVKSVIKVESDFNRYSVSRKGAKGLMQLMPQTARGMRVKNVFDPRQNIYGGTRYLKKMLGVFNGNTKLALAAYNAGPTAVKKYRGVPPYRETRRYIKKVFRAHRHLMERAGSSRYAVQRVDYAKKSNGAFYVLKNQNGSNFYTDRPVGKKRILKY